MGNRFVKTSPGVASQENQRVDRDPVSRSAGETSPGRAQARAQAHCVEVHVAQITHEKTEAYILVTPEVMEGERPQESGMTPSFAGTRIRGEANLAPELADSTSETMLRTDAQPLRLDLLLEVCHLLLPEGSTEPSPKTVSEDKLATGHASVETLPTGMDKSEKGTEDHRPSTGLSYETEVPESDRKVPCEGDVEFTTDKVRGAAEEQSTVQRQLDEAASEGALQKMAEPQPNFIVAESPDRRSMIVAALGTEQLSEGQSNTQNHHPLAVSEMEEEIPEGHSAAVSWKEREDLSSSDEVSDKTEFQNDQKVPCEMCLKLAAGKSQVAWAVRDEDVPGDCCAAENTGEMTEDVICLLKMLPVEAQDKMLAQGEPRDETACPVASKIPLEKDLEHTSTTQSLSAVEESPTTDVLLLGGVEFLDASQPDGASPTVEVLVPEAQTAVQARPPAEVTTTRSSSKALLETADTRKEGEEACPHRPLAEVTIAEAGSPEAQLPPETATLSGSPLQVVRGEEEGELVAATATREAVEIQARTKAFEGP